MNNETKKWGYVGIFFLVLTIFISTIFSTGVLISWGMMSFKYYKEKKIPPLPQKTLQKKEIQRNI